MRGLDELWRRRIVREQGADAYDFSHDKIREVAYCALSPRAAAPSPPARRAGAGTLHAARPRRRERRSSPPTTSAPGRRARPSTWYVRAADAAQRLHANAEAVAAPRPCARAPPHAARGRASATRGSWRSSRALPAPLVGVEGYLSDRCRDVHRRALGARRPRSASSRTPPLLRSLAIASLARGDFEAARASASSCARAASATRTTCSGGGRLRARHRRLLAGPARTPRARTSRPPSSATAPSSEAAHLAPLRAGSEVVCLSRLANTLWFLGHADDAERMRQMPRWRSPTRAAIPYSRAVAGVWSAMLALDLRDEQRLREYAEALGVRGGRPRGQAGPASPPRPSPASSTCSTAGAGGHRPPPAPSGLGARRDRPRPARPRLIARVLLEACALGGGRPGGLAAADRALELGMGALLWEAEARRLRAEFLAALDAPGAEVEAELERARSRRRAPGRAGAGGAGAARASTESVRGTLWGTLAERPIVDPARVSTTRGL